MKIREMRWGIAPPASYVGPCWGAVATYVFRTTSLSIPGLQAPAIRHTAIVTLDPDSQQYSGGSEPELGALRSWLARIALPNMRRKLANDCITPDLYRDTRLALDGYVIVANPRRSNGRIYLGAWKGSP